MSKLRLGLHLGYWEALPPKEYVQRAIDAERLGFDAIFTAESWGSDAHTCLTWIAAHTRRVRLGTAIAHISARTPAATAMHCMTLDHLSGGRVVLGLGVSGPQVVEGWFGQPFAKPLARTREYVSIIRKILAREEPLTNDGEHYPLPYNGPGSMGLGKPLRSIVHPLRPNLPIWLGAEGPKNLEMVGEIADGWLPAFYSPYRHDLCAETPALRTPRPGFEIAPAAQVHLNVDVKAALAPVKRFIGFYVGGMGARTENFHKKHMTRMGFGEAAERIQELFFAGRREEAYEAVPDEFADELSLVGPKERLRQRLRAWQDAPVTLLLLQTADPAAMEAMADLVTKT